MPTLQDCPISEPVWREEAATARGGSRNGNGPPTAPTRPQRWEMIIDTLVSMQQLGDDWDGLGATAPTSELLASAIGLAYLLRQRGVEPPTRVVPSADGAVVWEWQVANGAYGEIELVRPFFGEVMLLEPGQPAQHWSIPDA